jgi:peptidoglycan biosynthesis protein MviN/MurJ (putative lipid II flippase)
VFFKGGRFTGEAAAQLAKLVPYLAAGMMPMSGSVILFRAHYARNDVRGAAAIGILGVGLYSGLSALSVYAGWRLSGIGVAYIVSWFIVFITSIYRIWGTRVSRKQLSHALIWTGRLLLAVFVVGLLAFALRGSIGAIDVNASLGARLIKLTAIYGGLSVCFVLAACVVGISDAHHALRSGFPSFFRRQSVQRVDACGGGNS